MSTDFLALAVPGVRSLSPYEPGKPAEELERELGLTDVVKLASNESPVGPSPAAVEAAIGAMTEASRYPDGNGFVLKAALAERHGVAPRALTLGNGSNDVLEFIARVFVAPGDEVVFSEHAFAVYPLATAAAGGQAVVAPARAYGHDWEAMARAIGERTRLVFVANPNNPTGTWVDEDALLGLLEAAPEGVVVVVDQAYAEYVDASGYPDCIPWISRFPNLVVTRTFSKAFGLAGLRVGYAVSHPDVADLMNRVRQPFNVNAPGLAAAAVALGDVQHLERSVAVNREGMVRITGGLEALDLEHIPSVANFVTFRVPRSSGEIYRELLRLGVIVRPVAGYGLPEHLRVTVGLPEENERFLGALEQVLA